MLSNEIHESVKDNEVATSQLRQVIQENHQAIRRSHAASEYETLKDLDKIEKRIFTVEKTVRLRTPAGDLTALGPDRATSSGTNANFRELNLKLEKLRVETTSSRSGSPNLLVVFMKSMSVLLSKYQDCEAEGGPRRSIDLQGHRKIQDLSRGLHRQRQSHDDVARRIETVSSSVEQYEARSGILNQVLDDIRRQIRNLPASSDQARSAVRRELDSFRNKLEAAMRRITTVESNMRTLNGMNNRVMAQLSEIEGHVDEAADIIQDVQQNP